MLAQSFKTAEELQITEAQKDALIKTLVLLETGKLQYATTPDLGEDWNPSFTGQFNMNHWFGRSECGTIACIGGTAELIAGSRIFGGLNHKDWTVELDLLFYPRLDRAWAATPEQAATALRSYLTTGDARWDLAVTTGKGEP